MPSYAESLYALTPYASPVGEALFEGVDGTHVRVRFPEEVMLEDASFVNRYSLQGEQPLRIEAVEFCEKTIKAGGQGSSLGGQTITLLTGTTMGLVEGDYVEITSPESNNKGTYRIISIGLGSFTVNRVLVSESGFDWVATSAVKSVVLKTEKSLNGFVYRGLITNIRTKEAQDRIYAGPYVGVSTKPKVNSAVQTLEGFLLVTYSEDMRQDEDLTDPNEYFLSTGYVEAVRVIDSKTVLLLARKTGTGLVTLTVNASGTPKDIAGNPIDPLFNTATFTSTQSINERSIFTDKGPIGKPPLEIASGSSGTFQTYNTLHLTGANLNPFVVGHYLRIMGSAKNDGSYIITKILSPVLVQVQSSFSLPDTTNFSWSIFDDREGEVADDPSHVTVFKNGVPTPVSSVIGLLGQIVLPFTPLSTDTITVNYSWMCNPKVEVVRYNSKEFRYNNKPNFKGNSHNYKYDNVYLKPSGYPHQNKIQEGTGVVINSPTNVTLTGANFINSYVGLSVLLGSNYYRIDAVNTPNTISISPNLLGTPTSWAVYDQDSVWLSEYESPQRRLLYYRAYERAYTAIVNDPTKLLYNSPVGRVAYPQSKRTIKPLFVDYEPKILPVASNPPWIKQGVGLETIENGRLKITDTTTGPAPNGHGLFYSQNLDTTYPHVFGLSATVKVDTIPQFSGVFTGVCLGFSTDKKIILLGFVKDGSTYKMGLLKNPNFDFDITSWFGGLDSNGDPTGAPATQDWTVETNYRIFKDKNDIVRVFVDGSVTEVLRAHINELPLAEDLNAPLRTLQQVFFGSISREAINKSTWAFVKYNSIPTNPFQIEPSSFASYEANQTPDVSSAPWTVWGYHGNETILNTDFLVLDSTSATRLEGNDLVGGSFRGFLRIEPLLNSSSDVFLDVNLRLNTQTHGITNNAVMAAIDDGNFITQLCFFPYDSAPKISYGGSSLPEDFNPFFWQPLALNNGTSKMEGQILRIENPDTNSGYLYAYNDTESLTSTNRIFGSAIDYVFEFKIEVLSFTADAFGFAGAQVQVYDSHRTVGLLLANVAGVKKVCFHSEGIILSSFNFDWFDGKPHTYKVVKSTVGNLLSLFVDTLFVGAEDYSNFNIPPYDPEGNINFGSATTSSNDALSVVRWYYVNAWRTVSNTKKYIGIWKGTNPNTLLSYHLPLKTSGKNAYIVGNTLQDPDGDFVSKGILAGDRLLIDYGANVGDYEITSVSPTLLLVSILNPFPSTPDIVDYRVPKDVDINSYHKYRLSRVPSGSITVFRDSENEPLIRTEYNQQNLPRSNQGIVNKITSKLPAIVWGAFDPENLSQTSWDFVRYGITRAPTELRIAPQLHKYNQRNVMVSPEHLFATTAHKHTDFWSESTGQPPQGEQDFLKDPNLIAYTILNEGTPLVPQTQSIEVQKPIKVNEFVSAFNRPEDVYNSDGDFFFNDGSKRASIQISNDVLYSSIEVQERSSGAPSLLSPLGDCCGLIATTDLSYTKEVCLTYDGSVLPELAPNQPTPWEFEADNPANVVRVAFAGELSYQTTGATRTIYRNPTPLLDSSGLETEVKFRMLVEQDGTFGLGDSQIRLGFSAPGMTIALAFVTDISGARYVLVTDINAGTILGGLPFDFLDGAYHTYKLVRSPSTGFVNISIL